MDAKKETDDLFTKTIRQAGLDKAPSSVESAMRQSVLLLDHAVRSGMPDLAHAFQPLLAPLDDLAMRILGKFISPRIPEVAEKREAYFTPYLGSLQPKERHLLEKNGRYLKDNLVHGRSIQKLGTLLFCLDYAKQGGRRASGVWKDIEKIFSGKQQEELYELLRKVNGFRNMHVAHVEEPLRNSEEAWGAMIEWLKCLSLMVDLA